MSKIKVAVVNTVGRTVSIDPTATNGATLGANLYTPNGQVGTPTTVRQWLGIGTGEGAFQHADLGGLKAGDDHPQYTMWSAKETIKGQWNYESAIWGANGTAALPEFTFTGDTNTGIYRVASDNLGISTGGTLRWDVSNDRVFQAIPLIIRHNAGLSVQNVENPETGFFVETTFHELGSDVTLWMRESGAEFNNAGFRLFMDGSPENQSYFELYRHTIASGNFKIWRVARQDAGIDFIEQVRLSDGTASLPALSFTSDPNTGIYSAGANILGFAADGAFRMSIGTVSITGGLPFRGINGTAGAPTFSFTNDTDIGMYRFGADDLGFATGGTLRLDISTTAVTSTLPWQGPSGSAGSPSLSFSGDPNTGIYSAGADQLGLTTGGTVRLTVSTTSFTGTLPWLGQDGSNTAPALSFSSDPNTGMFRYGTDAIGFATGGVLRFGLGSAGEMLDASGSAGTLGQVPSSGGSGAAWTWVDQSGGGSGGLVYVNTSVPAGNTVANTVTETTFTSQYEIPASQLQPGSVVRIRAAGVFGTDAVAPTVRLRVKLDATTVLDSGAVTLTGGLTAQGWFLRGDMVCFTDGATGTVDAQGLAEFATGATGGQFVNMENGSTATIDTTTPQTITVTVEWGAADADNTITLRELQVDLLDAVTPTAAAPASATYLTEDDETTALPNSRRLVDGTNTTVDYSTPGEVKINASGGGGGSAPDVQIFTANGTWNKPVGATSSTPVEVIMFGGGGGGGGGQGGAAGSIRRGGGGGGGGAYARRLFQATDLASSVSVTVGAGGTAGTAGSSGNGGAGGAGGTSSFGAHLSAYGGGGGNGGNATGSQGGSGGGTGGPGLVGGTGTQQRGGYPSQLDTSWGIGGGGAGAPSTSVAAPGNPAEYGGASSGAGAQSTAGNAGGTSLYGGGAGGSAGGLNAANTQTAGSAGGAAGVFDVAGGGGGTAGTVGGGAGGAGAAGTSVKGGAGGGAGGGNSAGAGGAGGAGGARGGGGGAGGGGTSTGGLGGAGGAGWVMVITYL